MNILIPFKSIQNVIARAGSILSWRDDKLRLQSSFGLFLLATVLFLHCDYHEANASDDHPNILLICVDDLRPELACYGVDYIHTPNIDRLAAAGRIFRRHYVQAPTCGASRYTLLTGQYGDVGNYALMRRAEKLKQSPNSVSPSMPAWFRQHGYTTVSVGKVSHFPGGRGGDQWNDPERLEMPDSWDRHLLPAGKWKTPIGWMHGLANGEVRIKRKDKTTLMKVFQSLEGPDSIYPDGGSIDESLNQLGTLTAEPKPFFLSVGILRPHLPFGAPKKYLQLYEDVELPTTPHPEKPATKTTWHKSSEFMNYDRWGRNPNDDAEFAIEVRKHYAACVSYADAQVGKLLEQLKSTGADKNTIVVLWGDHGWHLGEHAIWGKHTLFEESLLSPLIISHPGIELPGQATKSMVESLDLFPTLCELTGVEKPDFVDGVSLNPILKDPQAAGHAAVAYHRKARTIRTDSKRLILHDGGNIELYDHLSPQRETKNIANEHPEIVKNLKGKLLDRLGGNSQQRTVD